MTGCPFCHHQGILSRIATNRMHHVECDRCGARSGERETQREAHQAWNLRIDGSPDKTGAALEAQERDSARLHAALIEAEAALAAAPKAAATQGEGEGEEPVMPMPIVRAFHGKEREAWEHGYKTAYSIFKRHFDAKADERGSAEPFVVHHYAGLDRPSIKGNGFDGLEIGDDRQEAEVFVNWVNARITGAPERK